MRQLLITPDPAPLAVVFVHGILGFDRYRVFHKEIRYFKGVDARLGSLGVPVYFPALPPVGRIRSRARVLGDFLARIPADAIALIGHSMGGLDSRYAIHRHDPGHRIRFLATVATPHRGTPLARRLLHDRNLPARLSRWFMLPGLAELIPDQCRRFNERVPDRSDVIYHSYAGVRPLAEMASWFRPWSRMIQDADGDNDSQVAVTSAAWGAFQGTVRADHLEMAGWSLALPRRAHGRPFDHLALYRHIMATAVTLLAPKKDPGAGAGHRYPERCITN